MDNLSTYSLLRYALARAELRDAKYKKDKKEDDTEDKDQKDNKDEKEDKKEIKTKEETK